MTPSSTFAVPTEARTERPRRIREARSDRRRATAQRFLAVHRGAVAAASEGLVELLERWASADRDTYHAALGALESALDAACGLADPVVAAARAAALACAHGEVGTWSARFAAPTRLRWSTALTAASRTVEVEAYGDGVDIAVGAGQRTTLALVDGAVARGPGAEHLDACRMRDQALVLLAPWAHDTLPFGLRVDGSVLPGPVLRDQLARALELLGSAAPHYLEWIDPVLQELIPVEGGGMMRSGTYDAAPGLVHASFPCGPAALAEMLVHEASHQYYHLAERAGPVHDGSDGGLYWSPARRTERPLDRILLAYHAFANIMLFYEDCLIAGRDDRGYCAHNKRQWWSELETLQRPLESARSLTPIGEALWRPLAERLAAVPPPS